MLKYPNLYSDGEPTLMLFFCVNVYIGRMFLVYQINHNALIMAKKYKINNGIKNTMTQINFGTPWFSVRYFASLTYLQKLIQKQMIHTQGRRKVSNIGVAKYQNPEILVGQKWVLLL